MPAGGAYQRAPPPRGSRGDAAESSLVGRGKKEGAEQPMEGGGGARGGARGAARAGLRRGGAGRSGRFYSGDSAQGRGTGTQRPVLTLPPPRSRGWLRAGPGTATCSRRDGRSRLGRR